MEDTRKCGECANFKTCGAVQVDDTPSSLMCEDYTPAGANAQRDVAGAAPVQTPPPAAAPAQAPVQTPPPAAPPAPQADAGNRMATPQAAPQQFAETPPPPPPPGMGQTPPPPPPPGSGQMAPPPPPPPGADQMAPPPPPPAQAPVQTPPPADMGQSVPPPPPATDGEAPDMSWDLYSEPAMSRYVKPKAARLMLEAGKMGLNTAGYKTPRELHEALIALHRGGGTACPPQTATPPEAPVQTPPPAAPPQVETQTAPVQDVPPAVPPQAVHAPAQTAAPVAQAEAPAPRSMMAMQDGHGAQTPVEAMSTHAKHMGAVFQELKEKVNEAERVLAELRGMLTIVEKLMD